MTVSVTDQALFFAGALVMGAAVGLLYDAFRILRVRVPSPCWVECWTCCSGWC